MRKMQMFPNDTNVKLCAGEPHCAILCRRGCTADYDQAKDKL